MRFDWVTPEHAPFLVALLNDPGFIRYIGDRQVRNLEQARRYADEKFGTMYTELGFGMYLVSLHESGEAVGTCGLVKRPELDVPDLGFALLADFCRQGLALEASQAVLDHARSSLGLSRLDAIVQPDNRASIALLRRLGFSQSGSLRLAGESIDLKKMTLIL